MICDLSSGLETHISALCWASVQWAGSEVNWAQCVVELQCSDWCNALWYLDVALKLHQKKILYYDIQLV